MTWRYLKNMTGALPRLAKHYVIYNIQVSSWKHIYFLQFNVLYVHE